MVIRQVGWDAIVRVGGLAVVVVVRGDGDVGLVAREERKVGEGQGLVVGGEVGEEGGVDVAGGWWAGACWGRGCCRRAVCGGSSDVVGGCPVFFVVRTVAVEEREVWGGEFE